MTPLNMTRIREQLPDALPKDNVDKSTMNLPDTGGSARVRFNGAG
jgi:hypothetical protein